VILNLKHQELVDSTERFFIFGRDSDSRSLWSFLQIVMNLRFQARHYVRPRRIFGVNEHRNLEIAVGEHCHNVLEVTPNLPRVSVSFGLLAFTSIAPPSA